MIKIEDWVEQNNLTVTYNLPWLTIENVGDFLILEYREKVFDQNFNLILNEKEYELAEHADFILYQFGGKFYFTEIIDKPKLTEFKYIGKVNTLLTQVDFPFLGIHGGYDLCNGSRTYKEWCKKAKFIGVSTLGIAEENTLAGTLSFQKECKKAGIKSIIGETVTVRREGYGDYRIKVYCKNREDGWKNLLQINTHINVFNEGKFITEEQLFKFEKGLIFVLNSETPLNLTYPVYSAVCGNLYYQLDFTEWDSQDKDSETLINIEDYLLNYSKKLPCLLLSDAFYLDREDSHIRKLLNKVGHVNFKNLSKNQFFKNIDDFFLEALELFKDGERCETLIVDAIFNTIDCFENVEFDILTGEFYLPRYEMSEEEASKFTDIEELFKHYIEVGFQKKVVERGLDQKVYRDRIDTEFDVIKRGGFIDYFLIFIDLYRFADSKDIWYGIGRGSSSGSVISYLTGVVGVDPIKYNLLFERFLNEGRLPQKVVQKDGTIVTKGSLPDIDSDWAGERRDEIKLYLEKKYGRDYITAIGTYGTFKLKNTVKDIAREKGVESATMNYITNLFPEPGQQQPQYMWELFHQSVNYEVDKGKQLQQFIQKYHMVVKELPLMLNQPKNASIHAAGIVLVPKEHGTLYQQLPVKLHNDILVSEWEGNFIDEAGFVKFDILGVKQFDKFEDINRLILQDTGKDIRYKDIDNDLENEEVFDLFRKGYNEDIFQLGGMGLKGYCKLLQPSNIEDLIATVALYRPGPIESNAHLRYVKRKNGTEEAISDPGCEEITKNTYGLIIYQEQTMQICQQVGGFSLVEADDVRKALGKMKYEVIQPYKSVFMKRSVEKGYDEEAMLILWDKMESFASYAFNRSHAAAYGIIGYYSQWFKANYSLQFWTVSLQHSESEKLGNKIAEIKNGSSIDISSVSINYSDYIFKSDVKTNTIYWALSSVKWVGDKVVKTILEERKKNGLFFSLEEFYQRMGENKPNKRAMYHLIICGAFDRVENITYIEQRYDIMEKFSILVKESLKDEYKEMRLWREYQWTVKEKELTGFGFFNFKELILGSELSMKSHLYKDNLDILTEDLSERNYKPVLVCGLVEDIVIRSSKKGDFAQIQLRDNTESLYITIWNEVYSTYTEVIQNSKNKIFIFSGNIEYDTYKHRNVVRSTVQSKLEVL